MKGFKSTLTNPYTYTQSGVWKKGQYTYQAVVLSDSGYAFAFQRSDTTWQTIDLSWQVKEGSYSKIQWTFTLEVNAVAFRLIANTVTGETIVVQPMLEKGTNGSTPIAHEEDLRGMDGDNHEFIFTRNDTGIAPDAPLSTQDDDLEPEGWTDNPQGVTEEFPFEFVSMREKKVGVWLDFSPPSLWAKWGEDGLSVNLHVEGHYNSKWVGVTKVTEIIGGVDVGGSEVVKVSAVFRKGETNIAATEAQSRGFQWYVNNVHLTEFDDQPYITLDETYGDGSADYVVLSYLVNSLREEERREILNVSEGMDGIGEEFIFKAHDDGEVAPVLPQTTDEGYQNDDYHGDWHDDPVAPTEVLQFVWVAKRKKVGGEWQAFGVPSVWTKWVTDGEDSKTLTLSASSIVMACTSDNQPKAGQTIVINAKLQNVEGSATFTAIPYNDAGTALTAIVLGNNVNDANEKTLTSAQWLATYNKVVITATLETLTDTITITRLPDGGDGTGILDVVDWYAISTSGTTAPGTGWQTTMPSKPANYYLWNYEVITYTDGRTPTETQKRVIQGKDARSIYDIKNAYAYSASDTVSPISGWQYSIAALGTKPTGYFLWVREDIAYTDNPSNYIGTIGYVVRDGEDGEDGKDGHSPYIDTTTNTWWTWDDSTGAYIDTGDSPIGADGVVPYPAGYYDNSKWYRREDGYAPYVQYGEVLYLLRLDTPNAGIPTSNTTYWKAFNQWEAVFVTSLVAKFAKIGGAVFTGDTSQTSSAIRGRMISETGADGSTNYKSYTGDGGAWQPKLMLDFLTGKVKFEDAEITGVINALSGKVGVLTIEESGRVVLTDPDTHAARLVFSESDIPLIADLVSGANDGGSESNAAQSNITVSYLLPNAITVGKNNSSIAFSASTFTVNANIANMMDYITVNVYLRKNGVNFIMMKSVQLYGPGSKSETASITFGADGVGTVGTYDVFIEITKTNPLDTVSSYISASTLSWTYTQAGIRYFQFGVNGMMAFFSDNHWYFTETGGFDLRGATNMPGVLLSATVNAGGGWGAIWGAKQSSIQPVNNNTGRYTVYHTVGHTNYQVNAVPNTSNKTCHIVSKATSNFVIEWRTVASSPTLANTGFDFQIIGNNYAQ